MAPYLLHNVVPMLDTLLCSNNPILLRSLYSILRDEGYGVDSADHPSHAVQMAFKKSYSALIIDSEPFGLSVEDAIKIIKTIQPAIVVIFVGYDNLETDVLSIDAPIDLEQFKRAVHSIGRLTIH
jgi:DNA-binding NtrC family response regulator